MYRFSLKKNTNSECQHAVRQFRRSAFQALGPPPLGEAKCIDFHRKNTNSECQHAVWQFRRSAFQALGPPPLGEAKCIDFH